MTLQQLEYFLVAASHRSFSAAAQALHMAQPSLSEQIRRLEAELGSPLFIRGRRGLELTEAGQLLRPHAERTLAEAQQALESVREVRELTGGTVAFGTFSSAHHYLTGGLVQDFRSRYPNVRVRLIGQNSSEVADAVRDGQFEAGLDGVAEDAEGGAGREPAQGAERAPAQRDQRPQHGRGHREAQREERGDPEALGVGLLGEDRHRAEAGGRHQTQKEPLALSSHARAEGAPGCCV